MLESVLYLLKLHVNVLLVFRTSFTASTPLHILKSKKSNQSFSVNRISVTTIGYCCLCEKVDSVKSVM